MIRALFICSRNRLRSPTAEAVFTAWPDIETASAGLASDADHVLDPDELDWADLIFVMERVHLRRLKSRYGRQIRGKRILCLDIPDNYTHMQPELIELLIAKAGPHLRKAAARS
jgi:predicted protein tyrosine phosphatase